MTNNKAKSLAIEIVEQVKTVLPEVLAIYLFGSFAADETNEESDIDIAFLNETALSADDLLKLSMQLTSRLNREVDIIELKLASTVLRMQVITNGIRLFCNDEMACEIFEDFVFSDYARLNEERAEILCDIKMRGSVYG